MPDTVLIDIAPGAALTAVVVTLLMAGLVARSEEREAKARDGEQKPQVA